MSAKEYLMSVGIIDAHLKAVDANIDKIRKELYLLDDISLSSSWGDGQPHSTKTSDPTGTKASKLADMSNVKKERLKQQLADYEYRQITLRSQLWQKRIEVIDTIAKVFDPSQYITSVYHRILTGRYIDGHTWEQIAVENGYTIRHIWRLHGEALKAVERIIQC